MTIISALFVIVGYGCIEKAKLLIDKLYVVIRIYDSFECDLEKEQINNLVISSEE